MRVFALLSLLLVAGLALAADPADSEVQVYRQSGNVRSLGSGTVVWSGEGKSYVLSAYHVCRPDLNGRPVIRHAGKEYPARVIAGDQRADLVCAEVDAELPAAPVATEPPGKGELVYQWGHPGGSDKPVPKQGRAVALSAEVFETTVDAREGDSGAGVFDAAGRLVGVCTDRFTNYPGEAARPLSVVRRFLWPNGLSPASPKPETPKPASPKAAPPKPATVAPPAGAPPGETDAARLARLRAQPSYSSLAIKWAGGRPDTTVGAWMDRGGDPRSLCEREGWLTDSDVAFLARQRGAGRAAVAPPVVPYVPAARAADCPPGGT